MKKQKSALLTLCGIACIACSIQIGNAAEASATQVSNGYENTQKSADGKCASGSCSANQKSADGKCASGSCSANKKSADVKSSTAKPN